MIQPLLTGSLPPKPYSTERFFGRLKVDGQQAKVAALACEQDHLVMISLVGFDTSVSANLAHLWANKVSEFDKDPDVTWRGPYRFSRRPQKYRQFGYKLPGTREVQVVALPLATLIQEGILTPPTFPAKKKPDEARNAPPPTKADTDPPIIVADRYLLGNGDEEYPAQKSFLGQLYALRLLILYQAQTPAEHDLVTTWANELWQRGLARQLIEPLPAVGITCWRISGDLTSWNNLIRDGIQEHWLPYHAH